MTKPAILAASLLALVGLPVWAQSSTNCDIPDADAATAHFDGAWSISTTDAKTGEIVYKYRDCSNPVYLSALTATELAREGGAPIRVVEVDGSTIMWLDEKGQAIASKPLNGSFMLMRYGYGPERDAYDQVLRYDRCPQPGSTCTCEPAP